MDLKNKKKENLTKNRADCEALSDDKLEQVSGGANGYNIVYDGSTSSLVNWNDAGPAK